MKYVKNISYYCLFLVIVGVLNSYEAQAFNQLPQKLDLQKVVERADNAGISADRLKTLVKRSRKKGLTDEQIAALIQPAAELAEQNLPGTMIIQKAFEGLAKGVPAKRIEPVILNLKTKIIEAKDIVDPWIQQQNSGENERYITKSDNEKTVRFMFIEATAHALSGGVEKARISALLNHLQKHTDAEKRHPRKFAAAIRVLSDLITTDDYPAISNKLLANAINAGFTSSDLNQLPQAMKLAQQNTRLPSKAVASGFTRQVESGLSATKIIQNLQTGNVEGGDTPPQLEKKQPKGPDQNPAADKKKRDGGNGN